MPGSIGSAATAAVERQDRAPVIPGQCVFFAALRSPPRAAARRGPSVRGRRSSHRYRGAHGHKAPADRAGERTQLVGWYDTQRAIVHYKCEGVSEADAHRAVLPASPLMTMAGVVSHLRWAEHLWFNVVFPGQPATGPALDGAAHAGGDRQARRAP